MKIIISDGHHCVVSVEDADDRGFIIDATSMCAKALMAWGRRDEDIRKAFAEYGAREDPETKRLDAVAKDGDWKNR